MSPAILKAAPLILPIPAEFIADKFHFKGSRDSLTKIIANMRNASATVSKEFDSWMTTYYPDKKDTWVTLWYKEKTTDKNGKKGSILFYR